MRKKCSRVFPGFRRKIVPTKNKRITWKVIKHNGHKFFCVIMNCLSAHYQEWYQLRLIIYPLLNPLPYNLRQLSCSPLPLPPTEYASPFGLVGHASQTLIANKGWFQSDSSLLQLILTVNPVVPKCDERANQTVKLCCTSTGAWAPLCIIIAVVVATAAGRILLLIILQPYSPPLSRKRWHAVLPGINTDQSASVRRNSMRDKGGQSGVDRDEENGSG